MSDRLEEIERNLTGIRERARYDAVEGGYTGPAADWEYNKRGRFMVRDMLWLISELKAAREDSRRLDWLEQQIRVNVWGLNADILWFHRSMGGSDRPFRDAIDQAIEGSRE